MSEVPNGWDKTVFGTILVQRREYANGNERLLSVTAGQGVVSQGLAGRRDISSLDKSLYRKVHPGDIVYNTMRMWQGVSGVSNVRGIVSPAYTVCSPTERADPRFLAWTLKHPSYVTSFRSYSQGMVSDTWNLCFSSFACIPVILPKILTEQRRIAEILDDLDDQIAARNAMVRKMSSIYADLVRGALYRNGDPSRWSLKKIDTCVEHIEAGRSPDLQDAPAGSDEWGVLKVSSIKPGRFVAEENKALRIPSLVDQRLEVRNGDLLISRANTLDLVGAACVARNPRSRLLLCDKTLRLVLRVDVALSDFVEFALALHEVRVQIDACAVGTSGSMKNISQSAIRGLLVPLPPLSQQKEIAEVAATCVGHVEAERVKLDKLRLLRKGMMEDLLTGKVRVTRSGELTG